MKAFKCLVLIFALQISFGSSVANAQYACVRGENPVVIQGSLNAGDVQQAGRITRDGAASSCSGDVSSVLENNTALRRDVHNLVNPYNETVCVRVEVDFTGCAGNQTQSAAYSTFNPANPAAGVIGDMGFSTINKGSYSFSVGPNASFTLGVNEIDQGSGCPLYKLTVTYLRNCRQAGTDITNDGKADLTIYRPSSISKWWSINSVDESTVVRSFGTVGDIAVGGSDYTGDGSSDLSVYRQSTNTFYYGLDQNSPGTNFAAVQWGIPSDKAVAGDFDGDGRNDVAVFRPSEGNFYVLRSGNGTAQVMHWGVSTDNPVVGDFDGDTVTDFAVVRPTVSGDFWWILRSNYNYGFDDTIHWGLPTDKVVPGDYDGDTITDLAVWRPSNGTFYVRRSSDLAMHAFRWGLVGDIPQPADFDGDGKHDFAVFRPSEGRWYISNSGSGTTRIVNWGQSGDQPMTAAYRIQ
ncbi:MAG TPA: VCBS repeat-containing protein [Pyrinomonadaceae bacterium]|nr:VCBS repeat-containing protein [Pyrinomonadaceae bacterium]